MEVPLISGRDYPNTYRSKEATDVDYLDYH